MHRAGRHRAVRERDGHRAAGAGRRADAAEAIQVRQGAVVEVHEAHAVRTARGGMSRRKHYEREGTFGYH